MRDELCQSFALLPRRSDPWVSIAKPSESRIKKFIGGRSASATALSVERPAKNELRRTIMFSCHPSKPMVDQRGFSHPCPGNDCNDVDVLVCPCPVKKGDFLLSTKNVASCNGQSGYGNPLGCKSSGPFSSYSVSSRRGYLLQALTSDSFSCVDCVSYCRNRLQKFIWALKTPSGILLKEHLKENNNRLRDPFKSFER